VLNSRPTLGCLRAGRQFYPESRPRPTAGNATGVNAKIRGVDQASIVIAGFAVVSAVLLFCSYAFFIGVPGKSVYSIASCAALVAALVAIEIGHLRYFQGGAEPLDSLYYRIGLFVVPSSFYFFGRWAILPLEPVRPVSLINLLPILLLFVGKVEIALPMLFLFGAGYSLWLGHLVYGLRDRRKQFRFEFFFFGVMSLLGVTVLGLGFAMPYIDHAWFYYFYSNAVALGIAIMLVALVANPNLIGDLSEVARVKYGTSTLGDIDVDACMKKLERLMTEGKAHQNEKLSLSSLAGEIGISSHQLSELINTRFGMGFSRYIRGMRIEAAKALLVSSPTQSILSVSMDTGFRSQSAFYAAFKEITGQSPGDYREARLLRNDLPGAK
jgi:AraC-like DNA-binding protein